MHRFAELMASATFLLLSSASGFAQSLTSPDPVGAGFVPARLERIAPWYQAQIDKGAGGLTGAVIAIAQDGKLAYLQAIGTQDRARQVPMKADSIFWIASMTKPVTSVAAMMLVEEGKLDLNAPVVTYLPELKDRTVGGQPARRQPQVVDLLRHTAGLTYPEEGNTPGHRRFDRIVFRRNLTLADLVSSLSSIPLLHQPGEVWEYSLGVDVLARIVEVVSGQPFDQFLETRLFKPLGMVDTGFVVPPEKLSRLVDPIPGGRPPLWDVSKPTSLFSGGGGLASTAPDYLRFCGMLLNGGTLDGVRILSLGTVKQMTTNTLPPETRFAGEVGQYVGPRVGTGWGLGFAVRTNPEFSLIPGAVGSHNWSGYWGTYFWIDPVERLAVVELIQVPPDAGAYYRDALRHLTYAALSVPQPPLPTVAVPSETLARFVGTYDFGMSLSARDRRAQIPAFAFSGVGLEIAVSDKVTVLRPTDNGPAAKAGVIVGDVITEIDGTPVARLKLDAVLAKLRGAAGTSVQLKLADREVVVVRESNRLPGARLEVHVVDGGLSVEAIGAWSVLDFENGRPVSLKPLSPTEFQLQSGERTRLAFTSDGAGKITGAILNPGPLQVSGIKAD
jgi:CubicO group peptidase (beta-lactamase class C family)